MKKSRPYLAYSVTVIEHNTHINGKSDYLKGSINYRLIRE
uniref:Uncharacterized protein n=2 Tax=Vibrio TaxID=662 RepID=A0A0H3ZVC2_9VIBR|nr:hypothetical protein [Vibrio splendidus]AKN40220.1 hypothetical protein [Vibrio tasmaniensis]